MVVVDYGDKNYDIAHLKDKYPKELENEAELSKTKEKTIFISVSVSLAQFTNVLTINKGYKIKIKNCKKQYPLNVLQQLMTN